MLAPSGAKRRLTVEVWKTMTAEQRIKAADACFRISHAPSSASTDGTITVSTTPGGGKKPHQRKRRRRTERTVTTAKIEHVKTE